jgi:hypothetical protein
MARRSGLLVAATAGVALLVGGLWWARPAARAPVASAPAARQEKEPAEVASAPARNRALPRVAVALGTGLAAAKAQAPVEEEAADDDAPLDDSMVADPDRLAKFDPVLAETVKSGLRRLHAQVSRRCSAEFSQRLAQRGELASAPRRIDFELYLIIGGVDGSVKVKSAVAPVWPATIDDLVQLCVMRGFEGAELGADESEFGQQALRYPMRLALGETDGPLASAPGEHGEEASAE